MDQATYRIGQPVRKIGECSGWDSAEVRAVFDNRNGAVRYVIECTVPGASGNLHIVNGRQLEPIGSSEQHDAHRRVTQGV